jgi:hypothetical protein
MTTAAAPTPARARLRAVGLGWLALSAPAIAVFAPLQYLLNPPRPGRG